MAPALPSDVFHAIADPKRRQLLDLLLEGERAVQALAGEFDISFAAVSQHLRVLREAGLVRRRRQGRRQLYAANPAALKRVHDWTAHYERFWQGRLDRLGKYVKEPA